MKKVFILFSLVFILFITGCTSDAIKFKNEYEALNGTVNSNNQNIREVSIPKNNPFIYKTEDDIVKMIEDKETFIVYFGFAKCPWCRSVLPNLINAAKDNNVSKIYYVDVLNIRDTKEIKDGNIITTKEGTTGYNKLVDLISNVLEKYTVMDGSDIKEVGYRIYAPNVVAIKEGKAISMTTGISPTQDSAYMALTDVMNKESYELFKNVIKSLETCDGKC